MTREQLIDISGWIGAIVLLAAYALLSASILDTGVIYHGLNLLGAAGVGVAAYHRKAYQAAVLELIWGLVAAGLIVKLLVT